MKILSIITCAIMIMFLWVAPGFSQDQEKSMRHKGGQGECRADIEKFCKDIKPGEGRLWACLKSNKDRLSQECKDRIAKAREKTRHKGSDSSVPEKQ